MKNRSSDFLPIHGYLLLRFTQMLSVLCSAMTVYALAIWFVYTNWLGVAYGAA